MIKKQLEINKVPMDEKPMVWDTGGKNGNGNLIKNEDESKTHWTIISIIAFY